MTNWDWWMKLKKNQNSIKGSRTKIRNKKEHGPGLKIKQIGGGGAWKSRWSSAKNKEKREKKEKEKEKKGY
jgi:hypothetical protein